MVSYGYIMRETWYPEKHINKVTCQTAKHIAYTICQYCDEECEKTKYELVHFDQFRILEKM